MIAIIGAMNEEITEIRKLMKDDQETQISNTTFISGTLSNQKVVLVLSGIGKVAAAMSTTILFENFDIDHVINIGTAGGLQENQHELDVIVSTKVAHHDFKIPSEQLGFNGKRVFSADEKSVSCIQKAMQEIKEGKVWVGPIVSGDIFVCEKAEIEKIKSNYPEALCTDMEAAAIAQVCQHYQIPFVVIRSLSDITVKGESQLDFDVYLQKASQRSAQWCKIFVEEIHN